MWSFPKENVIFIIFQKMHLFCIVSLMTLILLLLVGLWLIIKRLWSHYKNSIQRDLVGNDAAIAIAIAAAEVAIGLAILLSLYSTQETISLD